NGRRHSAQIMEWFPGRTGCASGVVVTANGLCGFFLAPISRNLLEVKGPGPTLLIIGMAVAVSWILCSIFFFVPDQEWRREKEVQLALKNDKTAGIVQQKQYTSSEMMRTKSFYLLLVIMLFGLMSYFMISPVSQTYQIQLGISPAIAVSAVMIGSIVNAGTRLVLPALSDKVGRIVCIQGVLMVCMIAMASLSISDSYAVTGAIVLMYGCYGGIMGSFPSFTSSVFGIEHSGENYGFVMLGIVIATIGAPVITGLILGSGYGMQTVFRVGTIFAAVAFLCLMQLKKELNKAK
ncbi:MAG: MFS transporter, partial [Clostridium sp.]